MKILLILLFIPGIAFAHDDHHIINNIYNVNGTASAIASSQIAKDWNTTVLQLGVGVGSYQGSNALAVGGAYKPCNDCLLFTGTIARENNETAVGFGINMRF